MRIAGWAVSEGRDALVPFERDADPGPAEVLVEVAGCGICHTDLGFFYDGVPTRHPLPLVLGHEISGIVVATGREAATWKGRRVIVPAVIPCAACDACRDGRPSICARQVFPGNDVHGGFATHVIVPAAGLCPVPDLDDPGVNPARIDLASCSVIADAVSTPYQSVLRSGLREGDLAVFVGAGGVGGFGAQIAAARGARVAVIDVDARRLALVREHGAHLAIDARETPFKEIRDAIRSDAKTHRIPSWRQKIFETSGTVAGQQTAFGLVGHGGWLGVVGYTPEKATLRLSNLMALDAAAQGNWGCPPEHYPAVLDLVISGRVRVAPFIERRPLDRIADAFADIHDRRTLRRIVLVPHGEP